MTPRQLIRAFSGAKERAIREYNLSAWGAWHIGILVRKALSHKKNGKYADYPALETLLSKSTPKAAQTPEQMLAVVKMLNAAFGGRVIE